MRALWLCLLAVACPAWAVETMRVSMGPEVKQVTLEGEAMALGEDAEEGKFVALKERRITLHRESGQLRLEGQPLLADAVRVRAGEWARDAGVPGELPLKVNGTVVRGDVVVLLGREGLLLVNVLPLEDYLVGVLGSEMPVSFPPEALKAQAVAARTYALSRKLEQYGQPWHLGSDVISQVYGGLKAEDPRTRRAVEETRGLVLTWDLQPIEAYFHASCGGHTETGAQALGRALPYLKSVECPCARLPQAHWQAKVTAGDLKAALGAKASRIDVEGRTPTGRVRRVDLGGRAVDAVTFRERLGYSRLKSLKFEVTNSTGGWLLKGDGFGHGAGLCQWGAQVLAEQGQGFKQILAHYYPGTELQTLY